MRPLISSPGVNKRIQIAVALLHAMLALSSSSFAYQPVVVPSVAPRMASPVMEMTDGRFPRAGKGVLPDGSVSAIPFLVTPEHLDGSMAGDKVRRPARMPSCRGAHIAAPRGSRRSTPAP